MKRQDFEKALALAKQTKKRNFKQSVEVIINLRGVNLKKPEEQVDFFHMFPHNTGKKRKICALVGQELKASADKACDNIILNDEFPKWEGKKKEIKNLASEYDFFVAQAPFMAAIAKTFGRQFGPKNKMPNPKGGCVVSPNANLEQVSEKLQKTVRVLAKSKPLIQFMIGKEDIGDKELVDNVMSVYTTLIHKLPGEESNIRSVYLKYTMGKTIKVGAVEKVETPAKEQAPAGETGSSNVESKEKETKSKSAQPVQQEAEKAKETKAKETKAKETKAKETKAKETKAEVKE